MALPDRYHLNRPIPDSALKANRAWLIAYDEEGVDGQNESTIKPNDLGDPALPGFVTIDVTFADASKLVGLVGGDFGVASLDDFDSMRFYRADRVWSFELSPETCQADRGSESFFDEFAERLPMTVTARVAGSYERDLPDISFEVSADGAIRAGAA
jgi:hypothetical protein